MSDVSNHVLETIDRQLKTDQASTATRRQLVKGIASTRLLGLLSDNASAAVTTAEENSVESILSPHPKRS